MHTIVLGDRPEAWERLGFAPAADGEVVVGGVGLRCTGTGGGVLSWVLDGEERSGSIDGFAVRWAPAPAREAGEHPNGAAAIDHVVLIAPDRKRATAALEEAGGELRRVADPPAVPVPMAFVRLGGVVVEVAQAGRPTRCWGLVAVVDDVDALAASLGDAVGRPRDAVQPGRRIVTAAPADGLETAVAFITPRHAGAPAT